MIYTGTRTAGDLGNYDSYVIEVARENLKKKEVVKEYG